MSEWSRVPSAPYCQCASSAIFISLTYPRRGVTSVTHAICLPPSCSDPIVDTTRTTFARAVLDRSAQTITLQSTFAYILNGDDNSQFALGPSDGQLIVANGTHLVKFASN